MSDRKNGCSLKFFVGRVGGRGVGVGVANCHGNQIGVDIAFCLCEGSV